MTEPPLRAHSSRDGSISSSNSGGGTGGFLSKITRSPSRRHKALGSIDVSLPADGSAPVQPRTRPGYQRTATAPPAPVSLNAIKADIVSRTNSDVSGLVAAAAVDNMLPLPVGNLAPVYNGSVITRTALHKVPSNSAAGNDGTSSQNASNSGQIPVHVAADVSSSTVALNGMLASSSATPASSGGPTTTALFTHIQEMSNKRIATLEYLRRAHEGRSFWFNTVQFSESDITRLPSYTHNRLSRRAVNYMLLGMSLPTILDVHPQSHSQSSTASSASVAQDYLKSLNTLLTEFETFQQHHPPDGSSASSLSRARIPQMFKRAATTSRPRKSSGPVSEIGLPMLPATSSPPAMPESGHHSSQPSIDTTMTGSSFASSASTLVTPSPSGTFTVSNFPSASAFPSPAPFDAPNSTLLPNEGPYTHLQTPPLPFTPDFFTVFATLCDVLIDTYQRLLQILTGPPACTPAISDLFTKVDGRIRKVMVSAIVREFEHASRETAKREMMGVQKVVLGGLLA